LGQTDLRQNGVNRVQGVELNSPSAIALDSRDGQLHLYILDTGNSRVLAWQDARAYQIGDPPTLILGQPGPQYSNPMGIGVKGFNAPSGMAIDPSNGNLYVSDTGNHRVLRFPAPFANRSRIEPDAVFGQADFNTFSANASGLSAASLNQPYGLAFDSSGSLWIADSGNHRVVRYRADALNSPTQPAAELVLGQKDFASIDANGGASISGATFNRPLGLAFDGQGNLYVADYNNARVLKFSPSSATVIDRSASAVFGQSDMTSNTSLGQASNSKTGNPVGIATDASGALYIAAPADNRVLIFGQNTAAATGVLGQSDFTSSQANAGAFPRASASTLFGASDVKVASDGTIYLADQGNNRVLAIPHGSKSALLVWGQNDFVSNGANEVKPGGLNAPSKVAIDYSRSPYALYVSDTKNHRVLGWRDSVKFRTGDPADVVIGQPDLRTSVPNVDSQGGQRPSQTSLNSPRGIAVDSSGNLYVADYGNNRVLRYPRPVDQSGRIAPDVVLGQVDFTNSVYAAVSAASLHSPIGLSIGPDGDLFVADSGNHRVLEFASGAGSGSAAVRVYGQPNFSSSAAPTGASPQTLTAPQGVYVDSASNLYTADTGANRLLVFTNTQGQPPLGAIATFVIGQNRFDTSLSTVFRGPTDVALDSAGSIYAADKENNRVLVFPSLLFLPISGGFASGVVGQSTTSGTAANWDSGDGLATAEGLAAPTGVSIDRRDTLYIADSSNNRVVHFLKPVTAVNAAHFQVSVPVSPGGLVSLFGSGFSDKTESATSTPLPKALSNREIVVNDQLVAPLLYLGPTQANFQLPSSSPIGVDQIAVRVADTGELIAGDKVSVATASPGLFTATADGQGQAAVLNQDGRVNSAANPAARGSVISIFGTGQGQVSPPVTDGSPTPVGALSSTVAVPTSDGRTCLATQPSVCMAIGNTFGDIQFSGLAPGYVGLWQMNVKIPADVPTGGSVPVRVVINGTPSNTVNIAVR
jgi:uncharacterized protein (TIGR03437 family)